MTELPYTLNNIMLIQEFLDETKRRIHNGIEITFTRKANLELQDLMMDLAIEIKDIEVAIDNLTPQDYYRGIDVSGSADFNVCAFCATIGEDETKIYLKYGLHVNGLEILLFSNHLPDYPMSQPFKN